MGDDQQRFESASKQFQRSMPATHVAPRQCEVGRTRCDRAAMMGTITNPVGPTMKSKLRSRGAFLLYASQQKHVD